MDFKLDNIVHMFKSASSARSSAEEVARVAIYVDGTATPFLIETVRDALMPQSTTALVNVSRLDDDPEPVGKGTDIVLVLSCGSQHLELATGRLLSSGAPVAVVVESSVEAPFIKQDTRMLSLICATDGEHLLGQLSRWILDHTEKDTVFAANFPFLRETASGRAITSSALTNTVTGALTWPKGADFPAMTVAQLDMLLKLAGIYGKPIDRDRLYEALGVIACAYGLRAAARAATKNTGRATFIVKAAIGGAGTALIGMGICELYKRDIDYGPIDDVVDRIIEQLTEVAGVVMSAVSSATGRGEEPAEA